MTVVDEAAAATAVTAVTDAADADDAEILDAYSRAVIGVVEHAGPAVVSLEVGAGTRGKQAGAGSGFFVTPDGYVMTNSHVVAGARTIRVRTQAGEVAEGQLVGDDPATDLALVRVDTSALAITGRALPGVAAGAAATARTSARSFRTCRSRQRVPRAWASSRSRSATRSASSRPYPRASSLRSVARFAAAATG